MLVLLSAMETATEQANERSGCAKCDGRLGDNTCCAKTREPEPEHYPIVEGEFTVTRWCRPYLTLTLLDDAELTIAVETAETEVATVDELATVDDGDTEIINHAKEFMKNELK